MVATLCFIVAGVIKGTAGVGLPIVAVGLMVLYLDPRIAMSLMVFPIMFANIWQVYRGKEIIRSIRRYGLLAVVLIFSLFATTYFTPSVSTRMLVLFVGITIVIFALMNLAFNPPPVPKRFNRMGQVMAGVCAGIMGGLTAIWSPPVAAYMLVTGADKDEFVRATGLLFLVGSVPLGIGFWNNGLMTGATAVLSGLMIIPTLIGFYCGEVIRRRLNAQRFKRIVLLLFLLIGLHLIWRSILA